MTRESIPSRVSERVHALLAEARDATRNGRVESAWASLEDAHVLAQAWAGPHVRVHLAMFWMGASERDLREMLGQFVRVLIAGPGSFTGRIPIGNTGRARVPLSETMSIRDDLKKLLDRG